MASGAWASGPPAEDRAENTYRKLEVFARVLSYVQSNYVDEVDEEALVHGAIRGMLETLDPHTQYLPPDVFKQVKADTSGELGSLGLEVVPKDEALVVVAPIDGTPAQRAGLQAGDVLLRIDAEPTRGMDLVRALQKLRGPPGQKVNLTILREGFAAPREFIVVKERLRLAPVEGTLYRGFAHLRVKSFQEHTGAALGQELRRLRRLNGKAELKGVVLDLRNNPGGLLDQAVAVADRFLEGGLVIVSTKGRTGVTQERSRARDTEPGYPLVVLVNAGSASASEVVAGALQDHHRATILGTPTFGKGSVQTLIELEDGSGLKLTIARYVTPRGRNIQERGIVPDFIVPAEPGGQPSRRGELHERDLRRHFRGDGDGGVDPSALVASLPPVPRPWASPGPSGDYQLTVALGYLESLASSATRAPAEARPSPPDEAR